MALTTSGVLVSQQLAATETTQYTAPATISSAPLKLVRIANATLTNTSASPVTVSVSLVKSGGTAGASNRILAAYALSAGDSLPLSMLAGHFLGAGDFISAIASTAAVVALVISGAVVS